jgi:O-antigen ligase
MAFKLCLIVLALLAIDEVMDGMAGVGTLFSALLVGTMILCLAGFMTPFLGSGHVFNGDRFGAVIGLSGNAGILLLLSTLYFLLKKNPWFLLSAAFSLVLMMLVGGKGGIAASFVSFMALFVFLKSARQALAACAGLAVVFVLCVAFTPFGHNLQQYGESGNASTLSGRTQLWTDVWPEIMKHPVVGHGYRASRFVSAEVEGAFAEAGHIHNAFLEVLYNNGVVGLIPILIMSFVIVVNLGRVLQRPLTVQERYFAAGALALYLHLLVWGMTAPTFGGTPDNRFMTFFALFLISIRLRAHVDREASNT